MKKALVGLIMIILILIFSFSQVIPATATPISSKTNNDLNNIFGWKTTNPFVIQKYSSCQPRNSTYIEYNSTTKTFRIWNEQEQYWINRTSGIQVTQDLPNWWTHNVFCINVTAGNRNFGGGATPLCTDTMPTLTWTNATDNFSSWVELNGTSQNYTVSGGYIFNIKVRYYLQDRDEKLSISFFINSYGNGNITNAWVWWKTQDIKINNSVADNAFVVNTTQKDVEIYDLVGLNKTFNQTYLQEQKYELYKRNPADLIMYRVRVEWLDNRTYSLVVAPQPGQTNSPVTLKEYLGTVSKGTTVLNFKWEDANTYTRLCTEGTAGGTCSCSNEGGICTTSRCYVLTSCTITCPSAYAHSSYAGTNTCTFKEAVLHSCCSLYASGCPL